MGIRSLVIGDDSCKVSGAEKGKLEVIVDYEVSKNLNSAVLAVAYIISFQSNQEAIFEIKLTPFRSDMFRPHRCDYNDGYNDTNPYT